jgi:hypothetical protein
LAVELPLDEGLPLQVPVRQLEDRARPELARVRLLRPSLEEARRTLEHEDASRARGRDAA